MNNPSPLIPNGSLLEEKTKSQSRVKVAVFSILTAHVAIISVALLVQGCKREQPVPPAEVETAFTDTNLPPVDTNFPPYVAPTSAPPVMVEPPVVVSSVTEYTIEKGDTFTSIAKKLGVTVNGIKEANPGVEPTKLKVGQKIVIPAAHAAAPVGAVESTAASTGEQTYTVKSGDTLSSIARHYGTTVKAIRAANNLTTDKIKVGEKLKIPAKAVAPTPAYESAPVAPPVTTPPVATPPVTTPPTH